jgi:hypothetical protein
VGIPEITPNELSDKPAGMVPLTLHVKVAG